MLISATSLLAPSYTLALFDVVRRLAICFLAPVPNRVVMESSARSELAENCSSDDLILDLGTKRGDKLEALPGQVVGIDIVADKFRQDTCPVEFMLADGHRLPFAAASFDYVYCGSVLEHVSDGSQVIAEAARVLKPSGIAYFGFPNRYSLLQPHSEVPRYYSILPKPVGHKAAPYLLDESAISYYEHGLHPLSPVGAGKELHSAFDHVDYTMQLSGDHLFFSDTAKRVFQSFNALVTRPPMKWPFELCWPNATYRCENPKLGPAKENGR